jgi:hypothetical protein
MFRVGFHFFKTKSYTTRDGDMQTRKRTIYKYVRAVADVGVLNGLGLLATAGI